MHAPTHPTITHDACCARRLVRAAAWGSASMSRALELLKPAQGAWPGLSSASLQQYVRWMNSTLLPQMDAWVAWKTPLPAWGHDGNMLANWHSSVAEAWLAYAIVADDRARYASAVRLYTATVHGYLKWGRGAFAAGRIIGETTETLRDVYHSLFGVGSLLQTAEMAWQAADDPSLYASGGHVLVAAMELHAAIVLAGANESALPHGYRLFESMPPPPDGCVWRIDLGRQRWRAVNASSGAFVSELEDGWKYVLGSKWLPTGWEVRSGAAVCAAMLCSEHCDTDTHACMHALACVLLHAVYVADWLQPFRHAARPGPAANSSTTYAELAGGL